MAQKLLILAFAVIIIIVLTMVSCSGSQTTLRATPDNRALMSTPEIDTPVDDDPVVAAIMLTQAQEREDAQAAATAEMARAMAQAVLDSANATLGVAQTQAQGDADQRAAELAATAQIIAANAQSTLVSAASTHMAAQTQDSIRQTQSAAFATSDAQAVLIQQAEDAQAAGTRTAVAEVIATQTQAAVATAQSYANAQRQRDEQTQSTFSYVWMCGLPIFLLLLAVWGLWAIWRWTKIQQNNQRILERPVQVFQTPPQVDPLYIDNSVVDHHPHLTAPDDQVNGWMDEVKSELLSNNEKDQNDNTTNS